jgi:hypothetical protein
MKAPTDLAQISIRPSLLMMSRHFLCLTTGAETFKLRESGGRSISAAPGVPPYVSWRTDRGAVPPLDGPPQSKQRPADESGFCMAQTYADQNTYHSLDLGADLLG